MMNSTGSADSINSDYKHPGPGEFATAPNTGGRLNIAGAAQSLDSNMLPTMDGQNVVLPNKNTIQHQFQTNNVDLNPAGGSQ